MPRIVRCLVIDFDGYALCAIFENKIGKTCVLINVVEGIPRIQISRFFCTECIDKQFYKQILGGTARGRSVFSHSIFNSFNQENLFLESAAIVCFLSSHSLKLFKGISASEGGCTDNLEQVSKFFDILILVVFCKLFIELCVNHFEILLRRLKSPSTSRICFLHTYIHQPEHCNFPSRVC